MNSPSNDRPKLLDLDEAAQVLSVGKSTIRSEIRAGAIEAVKIRRRTLVPASALDAYIAGRPRVRAGR